MTRATPVVRFEARHSNACWQFDISPSDLKHIAQPIWVDPKRGHPRLQNDLRRARMEEIGHRTTKFEFGSIGDERREFVSWLLEQCLAEGIDPMNVFEDAAQKYLAERLSTPLQFAEHLNRTFTDAYRMGADQVTRDIVEETISVGFNDLDARLSRVG